MVAIYDMSSLPYTCLCLQEFAYSYMDEEKDGWMLLDPTCNERNAQRIVAVWMALPEARFPTSIAVLCCFKRAVTLAETETPADDCPETPATSSIASNREKLMWKSMARIPTSVLRTIVEKTYR